MNNKKYRVEVRFLGKIEKVFETDDFELAKEKYREFDMPQFLASEQNNVVLLFIDGEELKFCEAEKLMYSVDERKQVSFFG